MKHSKLLSTTNDEHSIAVTSLNLSDFYFVFQALLYATHSKPTYIHSIYFMNFNKYDVMWPVVSKQHVSNKCRSQKMKAALCYE
jgi:hypothetical protein